MTAYVRYYSNERHVKGANKQEAMPRVSRKKEIVTSDIELQSVLKALYDAHGDDPFFRIVEADQTMKELERDGGLSMQEQTEPST